MKRTNVMDLFIRFALIAVIGISPMSFAQTIGSGTNPIPEFAQTPKADDSVIAVRLGGDQPLPAEAQADNLLSVGQVLPAPGLGSASDVIAEFKDRVTQLGGRAAELLVKREIERAEQAGEPIIAIRLGSTEMSATDQAVEDLFVERRLPIVSVGLDPEVIHGVEQSHRAVEQIFIERAIPENYTGEKSVARLQEIAFGNAKLTRLERFLANQESQSTYIGFSRFALGAGSGTIVYMAKGFTLFQSLVGIAPLASMSGLVGKFQKPFNDMIAYNTVDRIRSSQWLKQKVEKYPRLLGKIKLRDNVRENSKELQEKIWGGVELGFNGINAAWILARKMVNWTWWETILKVFMDTKLTNETQGRYERHVIRVRTWHIKKVVPGSTGLLTKAEIDALPEGQRNAVNIINSRTAYKNLGGSVAWFFAVAGGVYSLFSDAQIASMAQWSDIGAAQWLTTYFLEKSFGLAVYAGMFIGWKILHKRQDAEEDGFAKPKVRTIVRDGYRYGRDQTYRVANACAIFF